MSEKEYNEQLEALKRTTQKALKSKKSALAYLKRSGILDIIRASEKIEAKYSSLSRHQ